MHKWRWSYVDWTVFFPHYCSFMLMLQWLHNLSEDMRTPVGQVLGHMSHFHLGTVNTEFRGRCRRQCCWCRCHWQRGSRKFCFINGAACRGSKCLAEQIMSDICQTHSDTFDTVKHCQTSSDHVSLLVGTTPLDIALWCIVMYCVMNVLQALRGVRISSRQIVLRGHRVTMQLYFMRLHSP